MKTLFSILAFAFFVSAQAAIIEFNIKNGTQRSSWNTRDTAIMAKRGDTIRFINQDTIPHTLHTNGAPCSHGPVIPSGASWDCVCNSPHDSDQKGPLYDHDAGPSAQVWIFAN